MRMIVFSVLLLLSNSLSAQHFVVRELIHIYERQEDYDYVSRFVNNKSFGRIPENDSMMTFVPFFDNHGVVEKLIVFPLHRNVQYLTTSYDIFINWGYELRKAGFRQEEHENERLKSWKFSKGEVLIFVAEIEARRNYYVLSILPWNFQELAEER